MEAKRLLKVKRTTAPNTMEDFLLCIAATIEDSMLEHSNAIPNKDYTVLDLYKMAMPFALDQFKDGKLEFVAGWPSA